MSARAALTKRLGATSCLAAVAAACAYANAVDSTAGDLRSVFALLALAVLGILLALVGLIGAYGQGRIPWLAILGCILNPPLAFVGLYIVGVASGQRH